LVLILLPLLLAACGPDASDPWDGVSHAALCGGEAVASPVSPAPLRLHRTGVPLALPSAVRGSGPKLPGAWADLLEDLSLHEDASAAFEIRFADAAALADASRRCSFALPDRRDAYALAVRDDGRGVVVAGTQAGTARALATLKQLVSEGILTRASVFDAPLVPRRTAIEGFYGLPWSWPARRDAVRLAAAMKLDTYVHAPKADYLSTLFWREPYTDAEMEETAALASYAHDRGVEVCWEILPGSDVIYGDAGHRRALADKLDALFAVGIRCFVLAFDDSGKELQATDKARYPGFAEAQLDFVQEAAAHVAAMPASFAFVPNDYSTEMMRADPHYTQVLSVLPRQVDYAWTGPQIGSLSVTAADVAEVAALVGRPPALGDNYPVVDGGTASGPLRLLPVDRRETQAFPGLSSYGGNGLVLARTTFVALASLAELGWNPSAYDPARALEAGLRAAAGGAGDGLRTLAEHAEGLNTGATECAPGLRARMNAYQHDPATGEAPLRAHLARLRAVEQELSHANARLADELAPWARKAARWAELTLRVLDAQAAKPAGGLPEEQLAPLRDELDAVRAIPAVVADEAFVRFVGGAIASLQGG